ncbi:Hypothetical_protein [Hexamita inflata]|uniref:Hypothetical_protein n=1 Tax=Hexamita inflata TaxID=28002 RepID=A0ABP1KHM7_9EUKA
MPLHQLVEDEMYQNQLISLIINSQVTPWLALLSFKLSSISKSLVRCCNHDILYHNFVEVILTKEYEVHMLATYYSTLFRKLRTRLDLRSSLLCYSSFITLFWIDTRFLDQNLLQILTLRHSLC